MPEEGNNWLERSELMTYHEMLRLCSVMTGMGINKIRITGGEPFVRKDIMPFISSLSELKGLDQLTITTNGVLTAPLVPELKKIGIRSVNLSLDTLDRERFIAITHRDELGKVLETMNTLLSNDMEVKVNAVVMDGKNIPDIAQLVMLTKDQPVSVRFIEEMPFNGAGSHYARLEWDHFRILEEIKNTYPGIKKIQDPEFSTSYNYQVPGHKGNIGIIASYSRSFCGTCNRIRVTPQGTFKTCLYDGGGINLKNIMRGSTDDNLLSSAIINAVTHKVTDGHEAEQNRMASGIHESMATIGG